MFKQVIAWVLGVVLIVGGYMAFDTYQRANDPCEQTKTRFDQAIHYVGQSHVVTTINGNPGDDYWTRGYSGAENDAERATATEARASWKQLGCKGPINPNMEFWT